MALDCGELINFLRKNDRNSALFELSVGLFFDLINSGFPIRGKGPILHWAFPCRAGVRPLVGEAATTAFVTDQTIAPVFS